MRIRQLLIKDLFNLFHHTVPFNLDEHITIIHGANGFGKTTLLRLVNGLFNSLYSELETIPFSSLEIEFDNGNHLSIQKSINKRRHKEGSTGKKSGISFDYKTQSGKRESYHIDLESLLARKIPLRHLEEEFRSFIPGLVRWNKNTWRFMPSGENLTSLDVLVRFQDQLPSGLREIYGELEAQPEWLTKVKQAINVHFIQTQRLVSIIDRPIRPGFRDPPTVTQAVEIYSNEIIELIKNTLAQYAELSQSLDRTFPERLVRQTQEEKLTSDQLRERLAALERKQQGLQTTGLLEEERSVRFEMPDPIDTTTEKVLSVYVQDVENKLRVFDAFAAKVDLLRQIIDSRFFYKKLALQREKGFFFISEDGQILSPTQLSSGEQNELVLLYELLFKVKSGSLILIDEPEISFHVAWQQQFLKDLQQIIRLSQFDVLIATHSPQIINDRWDLTVQLQGSLEQKK